MNTVAALILAGGQASRLGGADKALLLLQGRPLLAHVLARVAPQAGIVALSANGDAGRFAAFGLPVLADAVPQQGPLAGVAAGLAWAASSGAEMLLTVPVDTPFIPTDLAARLARAPAAASWRGRQHHLVALWPVGALPALAALLAMPGPRSVRHALALMNARAVAFPGTQDPFLNVNTAEDLARANQRLLGGG